MGSKKTECEEEDLFSAPFFKDIKLKVWLFCLIFHNFYFPRTWESFYFISPPFFLLLLMAILYTCFKIGWFKMKIHSGCKNLQLPKKVLKGKT